VTKKDFIVSVQSLVGLVGIACVYAYLGGWALGVVITALLFAPTIRRHLQLRRYRLMNATQVHHAIERQRVRIRELEAVLRLPEPRYDEAELTSERRACEQELEELKISLPLLEERFALLAKPTYRSLV
jgi:hypothetical protein